jgi:hypothetical protein
MAGGPSAWCALRHRHGACPMNRLKTVVKWACDWNPTVSAISTTGVAVRTNSSSARRIRCFKRYSCGGKPIDTRNWDAKCMRLSPATAAKSTR